MFRFDDPAMHSRRNRRGLCSEDQGMSTEMRLVECESNWVQSLGFRPIDLISCPGAPGLAACFLSIARSKTGG